MPTPEEAKKTQDTLLEALRTRFQYWKNYLVQGGHGAQVKFKSGDREYHLSLCGQVLEIERIHESDEQQADAWHTSIKNCPPDLLADAAKRLPDLEKAILKCIEAETSPVREALATVPEPTGGFPCPKVQS